MPTKLIKDDKRLQDIDDHIQAKNDEETHKKTRLFKMPTMKIKDKEKTQAINPEDSGGDLEVEDFGASESEVEVKDENEELDAQ